MRAVVFLLALAGCPSPEKEGDTEIPSVDNTPDSAEPCDGTNPVLEALVVEDYGELYDFEDGPAPALLVAASAEDDDGDLHRMALTYWYDDVVDGVVDTSAAGTESTYFAMADEACATPRATYGVVFEVDGRRFEYETAYEFAVEVYDAAGLASNQLVASGVTPGPAR